MRTTAPTTSPSSSRRSSAAFAAPAPSRSSPTMLVTPVQSPRFDALGLPPDLCSWTIPVKQPSPSFDAYNRQPYYAPYAASPSPSNTGNCITVTMPPHSPSPGLRTPSVRPASVASVQSFLSSPRSAVTTISIAPSAASTRPSYYVPPPQFQPRAPLSPASSFGKSTRHSQFYFTDDLVVLNVDGCLFKLHRTFLERDSTYFRKLLAREGDAGRGRTDDSAIQVHHVTVGAFELLLRFVYNGAHEPCSYSTDDWLRLLSAATDLGFAAIRTRALAELDARCTDIDPVERILLARRYDIPTWLAPAYVALCMRDELLSEADAEQLGVKTVLLLSRVRERILCDLLAGMQIGIRPSREYAHAEKIVETVFWPEGMPHTV